MKHNKKFKTTHFTIRFIVILWDYDNQLFYFLLSNNDELVQETYVNCNKMVFSL